MVGPVVRDYKKKPMQFSWPKRFVREAVEAAVTLGFDNGVTIRGAIPEVRHVTTPL